MDETTEQKRARIVAEVAKARMLQLEREEQEQNKLSNNNKLTVNDVLGISNNSQKYNQSKGVNYEIAMHQKEFGARKFIKP
mmetsp:Transcript_23161/g.39198  ORF Transcript_23161/g.39198 Transcript_23161/m.39198 type:complete len:81 (+) Transcript_23161:31-273(+)